MRINRQHILILASILLVGFIIRWGVLAYSCGPPITSYPTLDEMNFRELAGNIIDYRTFASWTEGFYTVSTRAPVYPLLVAAGYSITGNRSYSVPKIFNLVFDLCNILLLFLLVRMLFNTRLGLITAGMYAVFSHASYFMSISSPHTFAVTLLLLTAISLICIKRSYLLAIPALSIIYTLLIHTRPVFLVALPFLLPAVWLQLSTRKLSGEKQEAEKGQKHWICYDWKNKFIRSAIPIMLILILCLPWGIRNYREHKSIVPVSIVAGWHIASNINYNMKLSIQFFTDQLYAPDRHDFKEADYFQAAKEKMSEAFFDNPLKFVSFGIARVIYCWMPPRPFYRFLLPQSYIFPMKVFKGIILPLPDFEGFIYLFIFFTAISFLLLKNKLCQSFSYVFYRMRGISVIIAGYTLVHIVGIPLIAYRFLMEPFAMIIFLGLICHYASAVKQKYQLNLDAEKDVAINWFMKSALTVWKFCDISKNKTELDLKVLVRGNLTAVYFAIFLILLAMYIPFHTDSNPRKYTYFALLKPKKVLTYAELREMQWKNMGNIEPETRVIVQGVVRYIHKGFKFVEDDYYAKEDNDITAARLFVHYGDEKNPLGVGDVRLNMKIRNIPMDGDSIKVIGKAKTGPFKEIIIDVEQRY